MNPTKSIESLTHNQQPQIIEHEQSFGFLEMINAGRDPARNKFFINHQTARINKDGEKYNGRVFEIRDDGAFIVFEIQKQTKKTWVNEYHQIRKTHIHHFINFLNQLLETNVAP